MATIRSFAWGVFPSGAAAREHLEKILGEEDLKPSALGSTHGLRPNAFHRGYDLVDWSDLTDDEKARQPQIFIAE